MSEDDILELLYTIENLLSFDMDEDPEFVKVMNEALDVLHKHGRLTSVVQFSVF